MKIKIIIAVLAVAVMALGLAGVARAQIVIVPGKYATVEECQDAVEAGTIAEAELYGIPKHKNLKGMIHATISTLAEVSCEELFGLDPVCPAGLQKETLLSVKDAIADGVYIDTFFMKLFDMLWNNCGIAVPPPACDSCVALCNGGSIDCSKIDPCSGIIFTCDLIVMPKECDPATCSVQCPFCPAPPPVPK
jgi:hypothetical protein